MPASKTSACLLINPFVFFATAYHLLNANHHDWMGVFAIGMALLYAGAAKILLDRSAATRSESLSLIGCRAYVRDDCDADSITTKTGSRLPGQLSRS